MPFATTGIHQKSGRPTIHLKENEADGYDFRFGQVKARLAIRYKAEIEVWLSGKTPRNKCVKVGKYGSHPTLKLLDTPDSSYGFRFGKGKAKLMLDCWAAVVAFAEADEEDLLLGGGEYDG